MHYLWFCSSHNHLQNVPNHVDESCSDREMCCGGRWEQLVDSVSLLSSEEKKYGPGCCCLVVNTRKSLFISRLYHNVFILQAFLFFLLKNITQSAGFPQQTLPVTPKQRPWNTAWSRKRWKDKLKKVFWGSNLFMKTPAKLVCDAVRSVGVVPASTGSVLCGQTVLKSFYESPARCCGLQNLHSEEKTRLMNLTNMDKPQSVRNGFLQEQLKPRHLSTWKQSTATRPVRSQSKQKFWGFLIKIWCWIWLKFTLTFVHAFLNCSRLKDYPLMV